MKYIAIFASGSGTNAENIIKYFSNSNNAKVNLVLSNRPDAYVLKRAAALNVRTVIFDRNDFYVTGVVMQLLKDSQISLIVLAGFLWLVPDDILKAFRNRIINIHPALLPAYGGKGMYGDRVHQSVILNREKESGITIHHVNENYDEGDIIFQAKCSVEPDDTPESLAHKIHRLEYKYYPEIVEQVITRIS
jgi:phosphoribosylglycinamide formyltransferase-1